MISVSRGALLLLALLAPACSDHDAVRAPLAAARLASLDGADVPALDVLRGGAKAAVFVFTSVECPISNRYAPELKRLFDDFSPRGVAFALVFCDAAETPERIRAHVAEFALAEMPAYRDPRRELVRAAGATVTPEATLVLPDGAIAYRGRIDDRFVDFGETRPEPTRRDLRDAIDATLAGRPVAERETKAVGCPIAEPSASPSAPTFSRDVAPILFRHCAVCHRPGEAAPFPLLAYDDAAKRADQIATVTGSGYMPPWLPVKGFGEFVGERRLDEREKETLARWAETGAAEGEASELPSVPTFPSGWQIGEPDLVIAPTEPYRLRADGGDDWRNLVLPVPIDGPRFLASVEIRPGNPRVVHHAILRVDPTRYSRRLDAKDDLPGFPGMDSGVASNPDGHFYGWTPGRRPLAGDPETAARLEPGSDFVLQLHLFPSGKAEDVSPSVGLRFQAKPPTRRQYIVTLDDVTIDIPPGEKDYAVEDEFSLPVDVDVLSVYPHAHFLGKKLHGFATLPDGSTTWLVKIDDWDFNWQDEYRFAAPVRLPRGSTLHMSYRYDNSEANVRNPSHPPRRVTIGDKTTDEMGQLILQVLPRDAADLARLETALMVHNAVKRPSDWKAHYNLALVLDKNGRLADAMKEYERVLELDPKLSFIHEKLGVVLLRTNRLEDAKRRFEEAIRLDPEFAEAHTGLGSAFLQSGDAAGAALRYEEAARLAPRLPEAHANLAVAYTHLGRLDDAERECREAIRLRPGAALAHANLGLVLARREKWAEAAAALEEALRLDPKLADAQRNLDTVRARLGGR